MPVFGVECKDGTFYVVRYWILNDFRGGQMLDARYWIIFWVVRILDIGCSTWLDLDAGCWILDDFLIDQILAAAVRTAFWTALIMDVGC